MDFNQPNSVLIYDAKQKQWLFFSDPVEIISTNTIYDIPSQLERIQQQIETRKVYSAGYLRYEAAPGFDPALTTRQSASLLLWFGLYSKAKKITFPKIQRDLAPQTWTSGISRENYIRCIDQVHCYLSSGDTYQVNFTFPLHGQFQGDAFSLFTRLVRTHQPAYPAWVRTESEIICSLSPELFFSLNGEELISKPMKGTRKRGLTQQEDAAIARELQTAAKDQAENVMIVDMIRNDMGRIATTGSVQVQDQYALEKYPYVWQMTSTISCSTRVTVPEILKALYPCASITGAPKARTMEIIAELEQAPRGIYTGTIGYWDYDRSAQFNVAIRTIEIKPDSPKAVYGVGSGIVWDSDPAEEYKECLQKATLLTQEYPEFSLMETLLWTPDAGYFLLNEHLARLCQSALYFDYPVDLKSLRIKLHNASAKFSGYARRVRLLVGRDGDVVIENHDLRESGSKPARLKLAKAPVQTSNRFLYHKTTHRHVYDTHRNSQTGCDDVILWNEQEEITEATIANVIILWQGEYITPPIRSGLLAGTYRNYLIRQGKIREQIISKQMLQSTDEIVVINSVQKWRGGVLIG